MEESRQYLVERLAGWGRLDELKKLFESEYTQEEIDISLGNAVAHGELKAAKYLVELGADISYGNHDGVYCAVGNNQLEGLEFALEQGVDINVNHGQFLNEAVVTAFNEKDVIVLEYILNHGADVSLLSREIVKAFETEEIMKLLDRYEYRIEVD